MRYGPVSFSQLILMERSFSFAGNSLSSGMMLPEIAALRLQNQHLLSPAFRTAGDVVRWFGAVQAQDYFGSLWAIGRRMKKAVEADIEQAITDRTIVRTWPMRGTIHFVPPEDVRWMLSLLTPRVMVRAAYQ